MSGCRHVPTSKHGGIHLAGPGQDGSPWRLSVYGCRGEFPSPAADLLFPSFEASENQSGVHRIPSPPISATVTLSLIVQSTLESRSRIYLMGTHYTQPSQYYAGGWPTGLLPCILSPGHITNCSVALAAGAEGIVS